MVARSPDMTPASLFENPDHFTNFEWQVSSLHTADLFSGIGDVNGSTQTRQEIGPVPCEVHCKTPLTRPAGTTAASVPFRGRNFVWGGVMVPEGDCLA